MDPPFIITFPSAGTDLCLSFLIFLSHNRPQLGSPVSSQIEFGDTTNTPSSRVRPAYGSSPPASRERTTQRSLMDEWQNENDDGLNAGADGDVANLKVLDQEYVKHIVLFVLSLLQ